MQDVQAKAQKLRTALPAGVNVDKLVAKHPVEVLNVEPFLVMASSLSVSASRQRCPYKPMYMTECPLPTLGRRIMPIGTSSAPTQPHYGKNLVGIWYGVKAVQSDRRALAMMLAVSQEAIAEAQRLVPSLDIPFTLENNPTQIFSFQRGSALIPYDDVKELW